MLKGFLCFAATVTAFATPVAAMVASAEMPSERGHTELSSWNRDKHGKISGPNYGVYPEARAIGITTGLAPIVIKMHGGQLTTISTVMNKTLPVRTYRPATENETALYRRHFS